MNLYQGIKKYIKDIDKHIYTKEEIRDMAYELVSFAELDDYFEDLIFSSDDNNNLGSYNYSTKIIKFKYDDILEIAKNDFENGIGNDEIVFTNLCLLEALFHEMMHVIQNHVAFATDWPLSVLVKIDILLFADHTISDEEYDEFHDFFMIEREAMISALENILLIIRYYVKNSETYELFKGRLEAFIRQGYAKIDGKVISPMEYVYQNIYDLEPPVISNMALYDRMKLGFPISVKEYNKYLASTKGMSILKKNLK